MHAVPPWHRLAAPDPRPHRRRRRRADDIERLYYISKFNDGTTICGLGDAAGYACSGILDKFRDEFEYCIEHKHSKFGGNLECLRSS